MITDRPLARSCRPTFPIVVVLPPPFTPTNSHTLGAPGSKRRPRSAEARPFLRSSFNASSSASGSVMPSDFTRPRRSSRIEAVVAMPTSARIRASSMSSNVSSVMLDRDSTELT